jgi:hypothetical protein
MIKALVSCVFVQRASDSDFMRGEEEMPYERRMDKASSSDGYEDAVIDGCFWVTLIVPMCLELRAPSLVG